MLSKLVCKKCGFENERNRGKCKRCSKDIGSGYPNVNIYTAPYYTEGLDNRYQEIVDSCDKEQKARVRLFEDAVQSTSKGVVNMDTDLFFHLVNNDEPYMPYRRAVEQQKRAVASFMNDKKRSVIDDSFYGSLGAEIVFAALSLDEEGLTSYGNICVVLNASLLEDRITVFEKNSFELYDELTINQSWSPAQSPAPTGHYSDWQNRHKLAVAKCREVWEQECEISDFSKILLFSGDNRTEDQFVELHVFGEITYFAFESACFSGKLTPEEISIDLVEAKEKLAAAGVSLRMK